MTRMAQEKQELKASLLKDIKRYRHLSGNNAPTQLAQKAIEAL